MYVVVENLYKGDWGVEFYVTYASEDYNDCVEYLRQRDCEYIEDFIKEVKPNIKQKVYLGGYRE